MQTETVMLSALQHYLFCPRQCALIHVEGVWNENFLTATGRHFHDGVDCRRVETRKDVHRATSLKLSSDRLGVVGVADVVEFYRQDMPVAADGTRIAARLPGRAGFWRPCPVEYKRGSLKSHRADEVQVCAQALCLEEMLGVSIREGALFYGMTRRRKIVAFDLELQRLTEDVVARVRDLVCTGITPPPIYGAWCASCSLVGVCRPKSSSSRRSVKAWLAREIDAVHKT